MEKLETLQREAIKKMSTLRLSMKLLEAGLEESQIQAMDRAQMMASWAEIVAARKDKPVTTGVVGYDPELERKRLNFEEYKFEEKKEVERKRIENTRRSR